MKTRRATLLLCVGFTVYAQSVRADSLSDYFDAQTAYFRKIHMVPILIARNQQVGDVYNTDNFSFVANAGSCFPALHQPPAMPTTFPGVIDTSAVTAVAGVAAKSVAKADVNFGDVRSVDIVYSDATVRTISALELGPMLDRKKCAFLAEEVDGATNSFSTALRPYMLVVGEIYSAKQEVHINYANAEAAEASFGKISALFSKFVGTANAKVSRDASNSVIVKSTSAIPVALRPAFVPEVFNLKTVDVNGVEHTTIATRWAPVDFAQNSEQADLVDALAENHTNAGVIANAAASKWSGLLIGSPAIGGAAAIDSQALKAFKSDESIQRSMTLGPRALGF